MSQSDDDSEGKPDTSGGDIMIPENQMNAFFFMDSDEEQEKYGASTKASMALAGNFLANQKQENASKVKQIADFKVRVLDFIAIYVKEMKKSQKSYDTLQLIKGLLKALRVAHADKNTILFDRIKTVLTLIARDGQQQSSEENAALPKHKIVADEAQNKDRKILMTEVVGLVLKPTKDSKMHQAYVDCFVTLTKQFCELQDQQMIKFVIFTYKELLKKFLGGRGAPAHCLNQQFFTRTFEECDAKLGLSLMKPLLRYLLPASKDLDSENKLGADSEMSGAESSPDKKRDVSRSNHQRLQAIEIFHSLVKASVKNKKLLKGLAEQLGLISSVLVPVLKTADSWQQKKVKKTMLALNVFCKLVKVIIMDTGLKTQYTKTIQKNGALIIKSIEEECEKDKSMSNLKGKIKEIQSLMENA